MSSLKYSPNLTSLARNFGEKLHDSLRLELAKTFAKLNTFGEKIDLFGENLKKFGETFGEELTRFFVVGTRQSIRQTFTSLARNISDSFLTLCGWSSPKGFNKTFYFKFSCISLVKNLKLITWSIDNIINLIISSFI